MAAILSRPQCVKLKVSNLHLWKMRVYDYLQKLEHYLRHENTKRILFNIFFKNRPGLVGLDFCDDLQFKLLYITVVDWSYLAIFLVEWFSDDVLCTTFLDEPYLPWWYIVNIFVGVS